METLTRRAFDEDELEHLHAAWCLAKGLIPYRDFFEHHTPALYFLLAPVLRAAAPEAASDVAPTLLLARLAFWAGAAGLLWLTARLGRLWSGDARTGWTAAALAAGTLMFLDKAAEVRPDGPALALWLGCLIFLLQGVRGHRARDFFWSGLCLGAGLMFTQKLLFAALGVAGALGWYVWDAGAQGSRRDKARRAAFCVGGAALPVAAVLIYFAAHGALGDFWRCNVAVNARWASRFSPWIVMKDLLLQNPFLIGLSLAGLARRPDVRRGDVVLWAGLAGLLGGLLAIPVPYPQYFILFLPLLALLGADALGRLPRPWAPVLLAALCLNGLWARVRETPRQDFLRSQLQLIRFVHTTTQPTDTVLDGWTGLGLFRPHAFPYFFLHQEIRAMLPEGEKERLIQGFQSGAIAPALVLWDENLQALLPQLAPAYKPVVFHLIWRRQAPEENRLSAEKTIK